MRITDEHIATLKRQGFVIIENFLTESERQAALEGFYTRFAQPYEKYIADGRINLTPKQLCFPWDHSGLNDVTVHPDLIDAAERIIGTNDIRLWLAHLGMKYAGEPSEYSFHIDYVNSTLGPIRNPDDYANIVFFYCFDDVKEGMAPIVMVPNGKPDSEMQPMIVPGGSLCIYSVYTRHSASPFSAAEGHRPVMWVCFCRNDRPWDGGHYFTIQGGQVDLSNSIRAITRFIVEATPRQLELIGFPPPGNPAWTKELIEGMVQRYPGFNAAPFYEKLGS